MKGIIMLLPGISRSLLVLACGIVGTLRANAEAISLEGPPPTVVLESPYQLTGEAALRAASLHVWVFVQRHRSEPAPLATLLRNTKTIDLKTAVGVIARGDRARLHRRLALLDLLSSTFDDTHIQEAVTEAVDILVGVEKGKLIRDHLALVRERGQGSRDENEWLALNRLLNREDGQVQYKECESLDPPVVTVFDLPDNNVGIVATLKAIGSVESAEKGIDAQRWSECSDLWEESYLVALDGNGNIEESNCSPPTNPDCMPAKGPTKQWNVNYDTNDPPVRPLFEKFVCSTGLCDVRILLRIKTVLTNGGPPGDPVYRLEYLEPKQWKGFLYAEPDRGHVNLWATDIPASSSKHLTVESNKVFGFKNWSVPGANAFLLKKVEMGRYLADLVCCKP